MCRSSGILQLVEAASSAWPLHPLFGFGQAIIEWCRRFKPENGKWPDWFVRDAMRSYETWNPDESPFFITPVMTFSPHLDRIEAEAVVWCHLVRVEKGPDGHARPRVLERGEIIEELKTRFAELITPDLDVALETAAKLGVSGAEQETLDDDMRRFVLKHFRRLKTREIAVAEARGDSWVDSERFDLLELKEVDESEERKINLSIGRAARALGIRPRRLKSGPEPT